MSHDHNHPEWDANPGICNCGTVREAVEAAEKMFIQLAGSDCPVWALQVSVLASQIAMRHLEKLNTDPAAFITLQLQLGMALKECGLPVDQLVEKAADKFEELHGYRPGTGIEDEEGTDVRH
jgi:hypothetical protein